MTTQTETTAAPVTYHWIATVQTSRGQIVTNDGPVDVTPGVHTHTSTYNAVIANLTEKHGQEFGLLFFSLAPNRL
ncbi:hypothetical protein [Streptomyces sp. NPDC059970]|uniref:hypothetical protein n=1 Tax=Streptomyces sp. NPDC059970 TaxID=3347019 RepID=UPI0036B166C8